MKKRWVLLYFPVLLASLVVVFEVEADAQGCAQRPSIVMHTRCESGGYCISQECMDGGKDSDFCSEGFGECCGNQITTANVVCDVEECCSGAGDCATGCAPLRRAGQRRARLLQRSSFVPQRSCGGPPRPERLRLWLPLEDIVDEKFDFWKPMPSVLTDDRK